MVELPFFFKENLLQEGVFYWWKYISCILHVYEIWCRFSIDFPNEYLTCILNWQFYSLEAVIFVFWWVQVRFPNREITPTLLNFGSCIPDLQSLMIIPFKNDTSVLDSVPLSCIKFSQLWNIHGDEWEIRHHENIREIIFKLDIVSFERQSDRQQNPSSRSYSSLEILAQMEHDRTAVGG